MKFDSMTMRLRQNLVDWGELMPVQVDEFLRTLRDGIRNRNGVSWQKESATVVHRSHS